VHIDYDAITEFIELSKKYELAEMEVRYKDFHLTLKQSEAGSSQLQAPQNQETSIGENLSETFDTKNLIPIKAPLTGVFYRSPRPNSPAFVELGEEITAGQVLCLVEAMKLMNEITSEFKGKIAKIVAINAQLVKEGQVLFYLEKI
jgi:biotin carboxyl carrier protein